MVDLHDIVESTPHVEQRGRVSSNHTDKPGSVYRIQFIAYRHTVKPQSVQKQLVLVKRRVKAKFHKSPRAVDQHTIRFKMGWAANSCLNYMYDAPVFALPPLRLGHMAKPRPQVGRVC